MRSGSCGAVRVSVGAGGAADAAAVLGAKGSRGAERHAALRACLTKRLRLRTMPALNACRAASCDGACANGMTRVSPRPLLFILFIFSASLLL